MQICTKKCACTAATVASAKHNEYDYYTNTSARARQARKKSLTDKHIRAALTAIGFVLLIAAASADNAELLGGRATLFVAAVGVLAMWTGTARNA
ncbi:hypothetical protein [Agathobaculum sp.]|uniref:hypothetical protein n=1 Tax=Agathobaculum sp. TaxID=2048138 RepID=UPI00351FA2A3